MKLAGRIRQPFLATGGRHGYGGTLGQLRNGLALDLSRLNSVVVDKNAASLTIGPGVRFRDIFDKVYEAGFHIRKFPLPPLILIQE